MNDYPTILIDTREQRPLKFPAEVPTESATLWTGDYSIRGLDDMVAVERKSLSDLVRCIGRDRDRFCIQLRRMKGLHCGAVVIEANLADVMNQNYLGKVHPNAVLGTVAAWQGKYGTPFMFCGEFANDMTLSILRNYYIRVRSVCRVVMGIEARTEQASAVLPADGQHPSRQPLRLSVPAENAV